MRAAGGHLHPDGLSLTLVTPRRAGGTVSGLECRIWIFSAQETASGNVPGRLRAVAARLGAGARLTVVPGEVPDVAVWRGGRIAYRNSADLRTPGMGVMALADALAGCPVMLHPWQSVCFGLDRVHDAAMVQWVDGVPGEWCAPLDPAQIWANEQALPEAIPALGGEGSLEAWSPDHTGLGREVREALALAAGHAEEIPVSEERAERARALLNRPVPHLDELAGALANPLACAALSDVTRDDEAAFNTLMVGLVCISALTDTPGQTLTRNASRLFGLSKTLCVAGAGYETPCAVLAFTLNRLASHPQSFPPEKGLQLTVALTRWLTQREREFARPSRAMRA